MVNSTTTRLIDLYVDESGTFSLTEARYRFFILAGIILTPDQKELADLLLGKWRKRYLTNPDSAFHMTDFFENYVKNYKKPELKMQKHFKKAVEELIDVLRYIEFQAIVYYVDLKRLRKKLSLTEPPSFKNVFKNKEEKRLYKETIRAFKKKIEENRIDHLLPLALTQIALFKWHDSILKKNEDKDVFKRNSKAYINFESLSGSDVESVDNYHRYKEKIDGYNEKIIGLHFHTKNSIDGGLELADIIAYVSCQALRLKLSRQELGRLSEDKHLIGELRKLRKTLRDKYDVDILDVTDSEEYKKS